MRRHCARLSQCALLASLAVDMQRAPLWSGLSLVQQMSCSSLYIETYFNEHSVAVGTGFATTNSEGKLLLVTNRHIVTGRHQDTDKPLHRDAITPTRLAIFRTKWDQEGTLRWVSDERPLYDGSRSPLWVEHSLGAQVDVAALPLDSQGFDTLAVSLKPKRDFENPVQPQPVHIIGFPFGKRVGRGEAIWVTGTIASDPGVPYEGLPCFLVDCRSREGQSGSPVFIYSDGHYTRPWEETTTNPFCSLVGVYSGRINAQSDLGRVWTIAAIADVVARTVGGPFIPEKFHEPDV